jgi:NADH dehydrogenase
MNDIVTSVDAPQRGDAGEPKSGQVPRRPSSPGKHRVVIVGGGFAGIAAAKSLRGCDADVTLIDRRNHHIFQPLLDQVGTAARRAPELGERTDKVLEELGFTAAEIEALRTGGAIPKAALHTTARA